MPISKIENAYLMLILESLKRRLQCPPSIVLIDLAKNLMGSFPREELPDWVEILANGNPDEIEAVVEIARADVKEAEIENHDN